MAKKIIISGQLSGPDATLTIKYRIIGAGSWITHPITPDNASMPYTIDGLPDGDYEIQYAQNCALSSTQLFTDTLDSCECVYTPIVTLGAASNTSIQIFFTVLPGHTYGLYVDEVWFNPGLTGSYLIMNLQPNRTYAIYIEDKNELGVVCTSTIYYYGTTNVVTCPVVPSHTVSLTSTTCLLVWPAVIGAIFYDIYLDSVLVASGVSGTSYLFLGLSGSTLYNFSIVTKCATNSSNPYTGTFTTLPAVVICPPPVITSVVGTSSTSITVTFTPGDITKDTYIYADGNMVGTAAAGVTVYTITGLAVSTAYTITAITHCSDSNLSVASNPMTTKTLNPNSVLIITPRGIGSNSITLEWPSDDNATSYEVFVNSVLRTTMGTTNQDTLVYEIENLTPATAYNIGLRAKYPDPGQMSLMTITTAGATCTPFENFKVDRVLNNSIAVSWTLTGQTVVSQRLYLNGGLVATLGPTVNSYTFTGLTQNLSYDIDLQTTCDNGGIGNSDTITIETANIIPVTSLTLVQDNTGVTLPHYRELIQFTPDSVNITEYQIKVIESCIGSGILTSGILPTQESPISFLMNIASPQHLMYRPLLLQIDAYLLGGGVITKLWWKVWDIGSSGPITGQLLSTETNLPIIAITSLGTTTIGISCSNPTSVITGGHAWHYVIYAMRQVDLNGGGYQIEHVTLTLGANVATGTITGLAASTNYVLIAKIIDNVTSAEYKMIPICAQTT